MNFNAPDYKEYQKEYFKTKAFFFQKKKISLFFVYENYTLSNMKIILCPI